MSDADEVLEAGVKQQVVVVPGKIFWAAGAACAAKAAAAAAAATAAVAKRNNLTTANGTTTANGCHFKGEGGQVGEAETEPCPYFRVSFVSATPQQLQEGFKRLGAAIRSCMAGTNNGDDAPTAKTAAAGAPHGPEDDGITAVTDASTASRSKPGQPPSSATAAAGGGGDPAAAVAAAGGDDESSRRPWLPADEGRLRVPSYFLAAAAAAPALDAIVPGAEPVAPGVDDQGLSAAAGVEEKRAAAEGREPLAARTSSSGL